MLQEVIEPEEVIKKMIIMMDKIDEAKELISVTGMAIPASVLQTRK